MLAVGNQRPSLRSLLRGEFENVERIFHNAHDSIFAIDVSSRILFVNQTALDVFGYDKAEELIGQDLAILMGKRHHDTHHTYVERHVGGVPSHVMRDLRRLRARRKDGTFLPVDIHVSDHTFGGMRCFIGVLRDMSENEQREDAFKRAVFYDSLTTLPNLEFLKKHFLEHLFADRTEQPHVMVVIGLSRLYEINATFGIKAGNTLIRAVATRLKAALTGGVFFGRAADSDRFHVLQAVPEHKTAEEVVREIEDAVLLALDEPVEFDDNRLTVTAAMGAVELPRLASDPAAALQLARLAYGFAKKDGRRSIYLLDETVRDSERETALMVHEIRDAIANGEFYPVFQPKIDLRTGTCRAAECLVRWRKPNGEQVSPARFIPIAERADLVEGIGRFMMLEACALLGNWVHVDGMRDVKLAVNVSPRQLERANFVDFVKRALEQSGAPPDRLELEITETSLANNPEQMLPVVEALSGLGVAIAIDDFGTGQSSLSMLAAVQAHRGKIDKSFLSGVPNEDRATRLLSNIVTILRDMNLEITVEGVEDTEMLEHVTALSCDEVQGFYYSKPLPLEEFMEYVSGH